VNRQPETTRRPDAAPGSFRQESDDTDKTTGKLWTPGDWNALFGLGTNLLVNLLVMTGLLKYVVGFRTS